MAALIELFSLPPNQTILDPFVGGGSTAEAALRLGHRFIGVDIDADQIAMTRARVAALSSPVPSESAALLIRSFGLQLPTSSLS
jgi:DNA modification methylase